MHMCGGNAATLGAAGSTLRSSRAWGSCSWTTWLRCVDTAQKLLTLDSADEKALGNLQHRQVDATVLLCGCRSQVCSDPFLTSADPVDAHLMDGRCMQQWAHRALAASRARVLQVP